jgi:tetratricopeptide (TPR) repeat protein
MKHRSSNSFALSLASFATISLAATIAFAQSDNWQTLTDEGNEFRGSGHYMEAAAKYREALRLVEQPGTRSLKLASSLNALALVEDALGRSADAENGYRRALAIVEEVAGTTSLARSQVLVNLSGVYFRRGQVTKAESMLREAIVGYSTLGKPNGKEMAVAESCLAEVLLKKKDLEEAERLQVHSLSVFEKDRMQNGDQIAGGLNNLGVLRHYQGRDAEAVRIIEEAVAISEARTGGEHPALIYPLSNLGFLYASMARNHDAENALHRAVEIAEKRYGTAHPVYGTALMSYSVVIRKTGRKAEAKKLESRATAVLKDNARINGSGMTVDVSAFRFK